MNYSISITLYPPPRNNRAKMIDLISSYINININITNVTLFWSFRL